LDFLIEPIELGAELDDIVCNQQQKVSCAVGFVCDTGTIEPQPRLDG